MRKKLFGSLFFAAVGILFGIFPLGPFAEAQPESPGKSFVLENGLEVFLLEKHDLPLFNMVIAVDVGSKDETDTTSGLVHILEHYILFRGTEFRSGRDISRDIRRHGAYFNAHTGHDVSLFEISLPAEYVDFALENQKEILFRLQFSQDELDIEKEIILEELNQLEDDPARYGTDLVFRHLFRDHVYGRSVYGNREVIQSASVDQLRAFHSRYFVPENCALVCVGDFDLTTMEEKIQAQFGTLKNSGIVKSSFSKVPLLKKKAEVREEKDVKQAYVFIGFVAPDFNHPDQYAVDVLTEIIGRGINPLLSAALRGQRDLVQTVNMAYYANIYGGALVISLAMDPKNLAATLREAQRFLKQTHRMNYAKDDVAGDNQYYAFDYLESAKNQITFTAKRSQESGLNLALSLAQFMLMNKRSDSGSYLEKIDEVRSSSVRKVAGTYLGKGHSVIVTLTPKKK